MIGCARNREDAGSSSNQFRQQMVGSWTIGTYRQSLNDSVKCKQIYNNKFSIVFKMNVGHVCAIRSESIEEPSISGWVALTKKMNLIHIYLHRTERSL